MDEGKVGVRWRMKERENVGKENGKEWGISSNRLAGWGDSRTFSRSESGPMGQMEEGGKVKLEEAKHSKGESVSNEDCLMGERGNPSIFGGNVF